MNRILTIALCALMLSGCIAEWKNPGGPTRWKDTPAAPHVDPHQTPPVANSGPTPAQH